MSSHTVVGAYVLEESEANVLGRGSFGLVFKGYHKTTGEPAAIKKVPSDKVKHEEAKILEGVRSDYVVDLQSTHIAGEFTYFVLELCDCDLSVFLKRYKRLELENVERVADSLARGYRVLLDLEVIHRDIKPQNILLVLDHGAEIAGGQPRILVAKYADFGVSREVKKGSNIQLSTLAGTPSYMAPEIGANIIDSTVYDAQVDMWSIGCVLYECFVGKEPFDESALCKLFLFAANRNYAGYHPPAMPADVPERYQQLIHRMLNINFAERIGPHEFIEFVLENDVKSKIAKPTNGVVGKRLSFSILARREFYMSAFAFTCSFCVFPSWCISCSNELYAI